MLVSSSFFLIASICEVIPLIVSVTLSSSPSRAASSAALLPVSSFCRATAASIVCFSTVIASKRFVYSSVTAPARAMFWSISFLCARFASTSSVRRLTPASRVEASPESSARWERILMISSSTAAPKAPDGFFCRPAGHCPAALQQFAFESDHAVLPDQLACPL